MMVLRAVTWQAVILRIIASFVLGGLLGLERGRKQRPAGLRTYMLVCVGACLIMLTNEYVVQVCGTGDPVRMGSQVVSGIGFLGAGTIIVTRHNQIKGLTTAAGLWAAAAVGLATGIGFHEAAITGALVIFLTLSVLSNLDGRMHRKSDHFEVYAELPPTVSLGMLMDALDLRDFTIDDIQLDTRLELSDGGRCFLMSVYAKKRMDRAAMLDEITLATQAADIALTKCRII
ncbi:MAG: MgtC/SapB family protein [Clostridiales bacterium]|nr:MgtC/SapB family protein [Clostridiales bacterium]